MNFHDIVKDTDILKAIDDLGFSEPTAIQAETIPLGLTGRDVIGQAKTGSGKTFAFGIPIMHTIKEHHADALVLVPTRELCQQVTRELRKIAKYNKIRIAEVYGGVGINPQIAALKNAQIIVGTPGRLLDHMERGTCDLRNLGILVLDEADRMLDMGFIDDIEKIISQTPSDAQVLLFSATMPKAIKDIALNYMNNPEHITTSTHVQEEFLPQYYYVIPYDMKFSLLVHLIRTEKPDKGIIFCGTRRNADAVARNLKQQRVNAEAIHGGLSQARRNTILDSFEKGKTHLLIATDVAARGLHISDVTHVFNYDVPKDPENYIHRIGRTARAGQTGKAITLLEERDFPFFQAVLNIAPTEPEELEAKDIPRVGFRKNAPQGRDGPRRGGPQRGRPMRRRARH